MVERMGKDGRSHQYEGHLTIRLQMVCKCSLAAAPTHVILFAAVSWTAFRRFLRDLRMTRATMIWYRRCTMTDTGRRDGQREEGVHQGDIESVKVG